ALDGDRGENTGGMGACSPAPVLGEATEKRVLEEIVHPLIRGMAAEGMPYTGVLYAGLMIDAAGAPRVVEFNVRFGDPETQALVVRMEGDLVPLLDGAARGRLDAAPLGWQDAAVCVVVAAGGYPREFARGHAIAGLDEAGARARGGLLPPGPRRPPRGGVRARRRRGAGRRPRARRPGARGDARRRARARLRRLRPDPLRGDAPAPRHRGARSRAMIPDPIGAAVRWLGTGGLVAYPTETVWGLAAAA